MCSRSRYAMARGPFQLRNTASIAPRSWSAGFWGKGLPVWRSTICWYDSQRYRNSSTGTLASDSVPASSLAASNKESNSSPGSSRTIREYMAMNRRYESNANRSFPVCLARPSTESSLSPRLRTVSIIPGIENLAPERTETSSGSDASPIPLPIDFSSRDRAPATSASSAFGQPSAM